MSLADVQMTLVNCLDNFELWAIVTGAMKLCRSARKNALSGTTFHLR